MRPADPRELADEYQMERDRWRKRALKAEAEIERLKSWIDKQDQELLRLEAEVILLKRDEECEQ